MEYHEYTGLDGMEHPQDQEIQVVQIKSLGSQMAMPKGDISL